MIHHLKSAPQLHRTKDLDTLIVPAQEHFSPSRHGPIKGRDEYSGLNQWLSTSFAPHQLPDTIQALYNAQPDIDNKSDAVTVERVIQECDAKLTRYRTALEAGADPHLVTQWITEVQARRAEALARSHPSTGRQRMSKHDIGELLEALGNIPAVLAKAAPHDKAQLYSQLGLHLTYEPGNDSSGPKPISTPTAGVMDRVRGGTPTRKRAHLRRIGVHVIYGTRSRLRCGCRLTIWV
jgi:hypothetical protein